MRRNTSRRRRLSKQALTSANVNLPKNKEKVSVKYSVVLREGETIRYKIANETLTKEDDKLQLWQTRHAKWTLCRSRT